LKYDEAKLWTAVVTQAIEDAVGKDHRLRKEAIQWIYSSRSFETVCELANLDFERLKNMLDRFGVNKEGFMFKTEILKSNLKLHDGEFHQNKLYTRSTDEVFKTKSRQPFQRKKDVWDFSYKLWQKF
jgi:hypothetical protein